MYTYRIRSENDSHALSRVKLFLFFNDESLYYYSAIRQRFTITYYHRSNNTI